MPSSITGAGILDLLGGRMPAGSKEPQPGLIEDLQRARASSRGGGARLRMERAKARLRALQLGADFAKGSPDRARAVAREAAEAARAIRSAAAELRAAPSGEAGGADLTAAAMASAAQDGEIGASLAEARRVILTAAKAARPEDEEYFRRLLRASEGSGIDTIV